MEKKRPNFIDYSRAIGIYLVVLGHYAYALGIEFGNTPLWNIEHAITLFHMPLFFILSGMLFKSTDNMTLWTKAKEQLIIPYVGLTLIFFTLFSLLSIVTGDFHFGKTFRYILGIATANDCYGKGTDMLAGALWFCYALVIIKFIMNWVCHQKHGRAWKHILICLMGGGISIYSK